MKFCVFGQLVPGVLLNVQPAEEILNHPHDMLALEELLVLQTVLLDILREVIQDERVHEIHDVLDVVAGGPLSPALLSVTLV